MTLEPRHERRPGHPGQAALSSLLLLALVLAATGLAQPGLTIHDVGFATPESVLYLPGADVYLVSNINGAPTERDGNGFISRVSPDGTVLDLKWIDGASPDVTLDGPKGMAVSAGRLWVADVATLRSFDVNTGAPLDAVPVPGATFLNDVAAGPDGAIYVTDSGLTPDLQPSGSDAVYRYADGTLAAVARGAELDHPNGVTVLPSGDLMVVAFGGSGTVYHLRGGEKTDVRTLDANQLDGVLALPNGDVLVSSWGASEVLRLTTDGVVVEAADVAAPADFGLDPGRDRLMIPLFGSDAIVFTALR